MISELESKLELLDRDARKSNIVLEGVPEDKDLSLIDVLDHLLTDLQVNFGTSDCDKIFRRGKKPGQKDGASPKPGPIVIVFLRLSLKVQVAMVTMTSVDSRTVSRLKRPKQFRLTAAEG